MFLIDIHTHVPADNSSGTFVKTFELNNDQLNFLAEKEISLGLHPWELKDSLNQNIDLFKIIKNKIISENYLAIGETGFDRYFRKDLSLDVQEKIFFLHYELACEINKPMVLHIVHAHDLFLKVLKKINKPKVSMLIHDFRGGSEEINKYVRYENLHYSFGKSLLSSDKKSLERFLKLPMSNIHLETDGDPMLSLLDVYEKAKVKTSGNIEDLAMITMKNASELFGVNFNK